MLTACSSLPCTYLPHVPLPQCHSCDKEPYGKATKDAILSLEPVPRQRNGNDYVRVETFGTLEQGVDTLDFNENYVPPFAPPPLVRAREIQSMYWTQ